MSNFDENVIAKLKRLEREVERLKVGEKPTNDGWTPVSSTWTYASATTINVPAGAAAIYKVGQGIKLTQTTVKYFYIVGVADTVLTITGGSDYTLANAAISAISYTNTPGTAIGFPVWFTYPCTITFTAGTSPSGAVTEKSIFSMNGTAVTVNVTRASYASAGATVTQASVPLPVNADQFQTGVGYIQSADTANLSTCLIATTYASVRCASVSANRVYFFATYKAA